MNASQKWIMYGLAFALALVVLFPPWQQTYKGVKLSYAGELGHHFRWPPPKTTGEKSWMVDAPPSDCQVGVEGRVVLRQSGILISMAGVLLFAFHKRQLRSMTMSNLALTSLALILCLPVLSPDGIPLAWYVAVSPISPFLGSSHLGPWLAPILAGVFLPIYFIPVFLTFNAAAWLSRRYSGKSGQPQSAVQSEQLRDS